MDIDPALGFNPVRICTCCSRHYSICTEPVFLQSCNNTFAIQIMANFERALSVYRYYNILERKEWKRPLWLFMVSKDVIVSITWSSACSEYSRTDYAKPLQIWSVYVMHMNNILIIQTNKISKETELNAVNCDSAKSGVDSLTNVYCSCKEYSRIWTCDNCTVRIPVSSPPISSKTERWFGTGELATKWRGFSN